MILPITDLPSRIKSFLDCLKRDKDFSSHFQPVFEMLTCILVQNLYHCFSLKDMGEIFLNVRFQTSVNFCLFNLTWDNMIVPLNLSCYRI